MLLRQLLVLILITPFLLSEANAKSPTTLRVIDGDSIVLSGELYRLEGIDAPEIHQTCKHSNREWACGKTAANHLRKMLIGASVHCEGKGKDKYGRTLGVCTASLPIGDIEINREMVASGWALDYRKYGSDYLAEEENARAKKLGMWDSEVENPWDWRHRQRLMW
jgi:endonuclease YncB( thermonuclease family)